MFQNSVRLKHKRCLIHLQAAWTTYHLSSEKIKSAGWALQAIDRNFRFFLMWSLYLFYTRLKIDYDFTNRICSTFVKPFLLGVVLSSDHMILKIICRIILSDWQNQILFWMGRIDDGLLKMYQCCKSQRVVLALRSLQCPKTFRFVSFLDDDLPGTAAISAVRASRLACLSSARLQLTGEDNIWKCSIDWTCNAA